MTKWHPTLVARITRDPNHLKPLVLYAPESPEGFAQSMSRSWDADVRLDEVRSTNTRDGRLFVRMTAIVPPVNLDAFLHLARIDDFLPALPDNPIEVDVVQSLGHWRDGVAV